MVVIPFFFFSSRRRHTRYWRDWSSDVCSSDLLLRGAGVVILAGQEVDRAPGGVYLPLAPPEVPVHAVEVGVPAVDSGRALSVGPPHLPPGGFRALGRHKAVGPGGGHHRAVDVRHEGPVEKPALYLARRLEPDHGSHLRDVSSRQLQHDGATHRATEHDGPVEPQGSYEG